MISRFITFFSHLNNKLVRMSFIMAFLALCGSAHAQIQAVAPPRAPVIDSNGIDLSNGLFVAPEATLSIGGADSGLSRHGNGLSVPYEDEYSAGINTVLDPDALDVTIGSSTHRFLSDGPNYVAEDGAPEKLACESSTCTYTMADGTKAYFDTNLFSAVGFKADYGLLTSLVKPDGEVITITYRYDSASGARTVKTVSSSLGWMLKYNVENDNAANIKPIQVRALNSTVDYCDSTVEAGATNCTGLTSARSLLISGTTNVVIQDPTGGSVTYNNAASQVTSVVLPSGATKTIAYTNGKVSSVTVGTSTWTYSYATVSGLQTTTRTDPSGGIYKITYHVRTAQLRSTTNEMGLVTQYVYDSLGRVTQIINPDATYSGGVLNGGYTQYGYDARGNVTSISVFPKGGGTPLVTTATYETACTNEKTCNKPLTVTDSNGVTKTFTYHASSGNVATETLPPVTVNGVSPQVRYGYSQIVPSIKNSATTFVAQSPVWRLTSISSCMTLNSCVGTADEALVIIDYGATSNNFVANPTYRNVLPVSITKKTGDSTSSLPQTTTFTYDNYGNVVNADGPMPTTMGDDSVYYFYDSLNRKTGEIGVDPDGSGALPRLASRITYDADGRATKVEIGRASGTDQASLNAAMGASNLISTDENQFETATGLAVTAKHYEGTVLTNVSQVSYDANLRPECSVQRLNLSATVSNTLTSACNLGPVGGDGYDRIQKTSYRADSSVFRYLERLGYYGFG